MTKMSHGPACCGVRNARECGGANSRHLTEVRLHLASLHAFFDLVNCRGWMHGHEGVLRVDAQRLGQGRLRAKKALVETREPFSRAERLKASELPLMLNGRL